MIKKITLYCFILFIMANIIFAACSDNPPILPNSFLGTATTQTSSSGAITNVSVGDIIRAYIDYASDTTVDGTFTVTTAGQYELGVTGCSGDNGKTINFTINTINANITSTFFSNGPSPRTINLNAIGTVSSDSGGSGGSGGGGGGGGGGGSSVSPVKTPVTPAVPIAPTQSPVAPSSQGAISTGPSSVPYSSPSISENSPEIPSAQDVSSGSSSEQSSKGSKVTLEEVKVEKALEKGSAEAKESEFGTSEKTGMLSGIKKITQNAEEFTKKTFSFISGGKNSGLIIFLILILIIISFIVMYKIKSKKTKEEENSLYTANMQKLKLKRK